MAPQWFDDQGSARFPWLYATLLYITSFGLQLLFLPARFWDDWLTNYLFTGNETKQYWDEVGFLPVYGFIQSDLLQNSPPAFRLLQLAIYFGSGISFFHILKSLKIPQWFLTTSCLIFLVLPINSARVSISMINYAISLALFMAGWAFLVNARNRLIALFAIPIFFVSFSTLTLIPFFFLPIAHLVYLHHRDHRHFQRMDRLWFAILLFFPFGYWFVWRRIKPPVGDDLITYFTPSFSGAVRASLLLGLSLILLVIVVTTADKLRNEFFRILMITIGIVSVALGASGYLASGRLVDLTEWMLNFVPETSEWNSRHQLLLGVGISVIVAAGIGQPVTYLKKSIFITLLVCMVSLNLTFMQGYLLDYKKQEHVIEALSDHPELLSQDKFYVTDKALIFNARGRNYRSYEIQGMLMQALSASAQQVSEIEIATASTCTTEFGSDVLVVIETFSGRLRALLTLDPAISVTITRGFCLTPT